MTHLIHNCDQSVLDQSRIATTSDWPVSVSDSESDSHCSNEIDLVAVGDILFIVYGPTNELLPHVFLLSICRHEMRAKRDLRVMTTLPCRRVSVIRACSIATPTRGSAEFP